MFKRDTILIEHIRLPNYYVVEGRGLASHSLFMGIM